MSKIFIFFLMGAVAIGMLLADSVNGTTALLLVVIMSAGFVLIFRRLTDERTFITNIFLTALCLRLLFGILLHIYEMRDFVGPDSLGYDELASTVVDYWLGVNTTNSTAIIEALSLKGPGWGMIYLVSCIYLILGKSIFVAQSFCAVVGAATIPLVYFCTDTIFHNRRVARTAAIATTFFPAFIIWSSQLLKDGLIVFLLVLIMTVVLELQKRFRWQGIVGVILCLFGILSLRFYIFYMVLIAVVGSFVVGQSNSVKAILQRTGILLILGLGLTYLGVIRTASLDISKYGSLEKVQISRADLARGDSGYGNEENVSTLGGALSAIPIGFLYLIFAPFPWEVKNLRQSLTLPEIFLWWSMMPLLVYGLWYTVKNRLRASVPVLIFTLMLTVSYSIFQGNLGAAYRQRTQIQIFLFIFIAVGWGLIRERMEDRKLVETTRRLRMAAKLRNGLQQTRQI